MNTRYFNLLTFSTIFSIIISVYGQIYPRPCPIPISKLSNLEYNETKLNPSLRSSLPVIEESFSNQNKPKINKKEDILNIYKPNLFIHHLII